MARDHSFRFVEQEVDLAGRLEALAIQVNDILFQAHPEVGVARDLPVHLQAPLQDGRAGIGP